MLCTTSIKEVWVAKGGRGNSGICMTSMSEVFRRVQPVNQKENVRFRGSGYRRALRETMMMTILACMMVSNLLSVPEIVSLLT